MFNVFIPDHKLGWPVAPFHRSPLVLCNNPARKIYKQEKDCYGVLTVKLVKFVNKINIVQRHWTLLVITQNNNC